MRKAITCCIAAFLSMTLLLGTAFASGGAAERIDYADGSYAIITTVTGGITRGTVDDHKSYTYYDSDGNRCFAYTLFATFNYDGRSSEVEDIDYQADVYQRGWDISSHSEWTSGDTAYGRAVFTDPDGGRHSVSLSLTCDEGGNVS